MVVEDYDILGTAASRRDAGESRILGDVDPPATIRPLRGGDAPAVAAFYASAHREDPAVREVSEEAWRGLVAYPSNAGGGDFAVAESGGRVVGTLTSTALEALQRGRRVRHLRIAVLPAVRRRGIGSALLRLAEGQPLGGPRATLQAYVPASWTAALAFYGARGFERVHADLEMDRDGPPPEGRIAAGYAIRPFGREGDAAAWVRLHNEGYGGEFLFLPYGEREVAADLGLPGARAWMAEADGAVVGMCFTHTEPAAGGCVQGLVVDARHRGRGLGRALLAAGLRTLAEQGRTAVELGVDGDNAPARALYRSAGFRVREESHVLWRDR